jgi:DNA polymerase III subunit epsilon
MREIVFDTETTGLSPRDGHRLVEIGCIEMIDRFPTGRTFHAYINPQRDMPVEAFNVHGLSAAFLSDKPVFKAIAEDFAGFIGDAIMVAHNANFDITFINAEFATLKMPPVSADRIIDTVMIARRKFPGQKNDLDSLCQRLGVDNSRRTKHGALMDAELLADVYLELTGGRQTALSLGGAGSGAGRGVIGAAPKRVRPVPSGLTPGEAAAHAAFVAELGKDAIWASYIERPPEEATVS